MNIKRRIIGSKYKDNEKSNASRFIALSLLSLIFAGASAQTGKVTVNLKDASVKELFSQIERQTNYRFSYRNVEVDKKPEITVSVKNAELKSVLTRELSKLGLKYTVMGNTIVVMAVEKAAPSVRGVVKGKVVDASGEPIVGATVRQGDTSNGTITDIDGAFTLNVDKGSTLNVSYVGYKTVDQKVVFGKSMLITLLEDSELLDEVVVVGYGTQKKVNLTGAVSVVESDALIDRSSSNMSRLLQGTVPNLTVNFGSGSPNQSGTINIRGVNTISGSAGPLVLIDGIEGDINTVNPNDVESISVLKDASSAAVYGARAAYGVVLVTTKGSKEEKVSVTYNGRFSFGDTTTSTDYETRGFYSAAIANLFYSTYQGVPYQDLTSEDYYELWIRRNDKTENPDRPWVVEKNGQYKYYGNFDWYNFFFDDTRPTWEHNVSVSGGTDKVKYLISGNYYNQEGVIRIDPDRYKRYNFRSKLSVDVTDWLQISNNTAFYAKDYSYPGRSGTEQIFNWITGGALANVVPVNPDGTYVYTNPMSSTGANAVAGGGSAILLNNHEQGKQPNKESTTDFSTTFEAVIKPVKHFEIRANYNWARMEYKTVQRNLDCQYSSTPGVIFDMPTSASGGNYLAQSSNYQTRQTFNLYGTYDNVFANDHAVKIMVGGNYESRYSKDFYARRNGSLANNLNDFDLATGDDMTIEGGQSEYKLLGFFYRLNYGYKDRYLFEASGRYDGSSRFRSGHRFGFFPSFSAAWRVSEEEFFKPAREYMDNLKLRLSYGSLGNQSSVGYYDYIQLINTGQQLGYLFGGSNRVYYASESDPNASDMTWETIVTKNIGLDMGFFGNRLNVSVDAYIRDTKDMLMEGRTLPAVYGAASPKMNAADLRTKGWEMSISWADKFMLASKPLNYQLSFGLGDNTSKVTKYDNPDCTLTDPYVGQQLGEIWGYKIDGYFKTDEEAANYAVDQTLVNTMINQSVVDNGLHAGDLKYIDVDGNGKIEETTSAKNVKDQVVIGNSLPRYNYSASLSAQWNGIDLSVFFQGIVRQNWYPGGEAMAFWGPYARPYTSLVPRDFMSNVWSEDNPDAYFPRPRGYVALISNRELVETNDRYLQNIGYCRLKNLTIGYTLPKQWTSKVGIEKLRVYFSGENLLTFTKLKSDYIDPEQASAGLSWNSYSNSVQNYPYSKTFSFGMELKF